MNAQLPTQGFDDDGVDLTAAEYVLGVLDADALRAARRRLRTDAAFAREVASWEAHFQPWIDAIAPVPAPGTAWDRIQAGLGWRASTAATPAPAARGGIGFWRGLAFGGIAVAAVSTIALMFALQRPPVQLPAPPAPPPVVTKQIVTPDMVAKIATDDGRAMLVASLDSASGEMTVAPVDDMQVPAGRAAELWLIPAGGAPRSLGVIDPTHANAMTVPDALRSGFDKDAVLAVSIEPMGGSATGLPTGPVVAKGAMRAV